LDDTFTLLAMMGEEADPLVELKLKQYKGEQSLEFFPTRDLSAGDWPHLLGFARFVMYNEDAPEPVLYAKNSA